LTLVSAGYDAHEDDPLASMRMTAAGYAAVVARLRRIASRHGALALVTEGGYDLPALAACLEASFAAIDREDNPPDGDGLPAAASRGERAVAAARTALKPYWREL
jgi:acetoin utilization deacetylase AcuC-like enzyme